MLEEDVREQLDACGGRNVWQSEQACVLCATIEHSTKIGVDGDQDTLFSRRHLKDDVVAWIGGRARTLRSRRGFVPEAIRPDDGRHSDQLGISLGQLNCVEGVICQHGMRVGKASPDVIWIKAWVVGEDGL